jgi:hypothetical protein
MTKNEFFLKTDREILFAITNGRKYYYMIGIVLPCGVDEFRKQYSEFIIETRRCRNCNPAKYDIIFTLPLTNI